MKKILYHFSKMTNAAHNLALEEYLFRNRREGSIFLIWQNAPAVIIGKNQVASAEVDLSYARANGIPVLRRLTGGGAVYHDLGNINFSFLEDYHPESMPRFSHFVSPIVDFLRNLNLPAVAGSRNDVLVCRHKVCGTAFSINRSLSRILVHGCLLFSVDLDILSAILTPPPEKLARHGIPSVRSRVANLGDFLPDETLESFKDKLADYVFSQRISEKLRLDLAEVKDIFSLAGTYQDLA